MLVISLDVNETVTAEAGAMTYMQPNIQVKTRKRERSLLGTIGLSIFGRQSFFVNDYTAQNTTGEVAFVSAPVGDIEILELNQNQGYIIQSSSYIASPECGFIKRDSVTEPFGFTSAASLNS